MRRNRLLGLGELPKDPVLGRCCKPELGTCVEPYLTREPAHLSATVFPHSDQAEDQSGGQVETILDRLGVRPLFPPSSLCYYLSCLGATGSFLCLLKLRLLAYSPNPLLCNEMHQNSCIVQPHPTDAMSGTQRAT